jgi:AcrR family transcriptional regulator
VVPSRGRPRDAQIDVRVLEATRELLATVGFDQTTIQSVARRAKVGASTIYRRWPSRIELIQEAVYPGFDDVTITPTGDVRRDLRRFIDAYTDAFTHPAARAALPGLLATYHAGAATSFADGHFAHDMRPHFRAMLAAAPAGALDPDIDGDALLDLLIGAVIYRALLLPLTDRADAPDHTAELLERIVAPAPKRSGKWPAGRLSRLGRTDA